MMPSPALDISRQIGRRTSERGAHERHAGVPEIHGTEMPGHFAAGADAAKETAIALLILWVLSSHFFSLNLIWYSASFLFSAGWILWKTGRSALLGWARWKGSIA